MNNDEIMKIFHKAYSGKLIKEDLSKLSDWLFNISIDDDNVFHLIETIGYAYVNGFEFEKNDDVKNKMIEWTERNYPPALAGTCLHVLIFKCNWQGEIAKNKILDFLTPTVWDEGNYAMSSAISAASIWLKKFGEDMEIRNSLNVLLNNKKTLKIIREQIIQMC